MIMIRKSHDAKFSPIVIEVESSHTASVELFILSVSEELILGHYENLLPFDLITVVSNENIVSETTVREDHFNSNGSPWKEGTLGGIISCGGDLYGITAGHVDKTTDAPFDESAEAVINIVDPFIDVSFFKFIGHDADTATNVLPLTLAPDVVLEVGEVVFKHGKSTGLQTGILVSEAVDFLCPVSRKRFLNHVKVRWNADGSRFGFHGDCGSLYCVKRGAMYVPIAIHRLSADEIGGDGKFSYGCRFSDAMDYFTPGEENEVMFRNPPYCTTIG
jgi:hypothetical protein